MPGFQSFVILIFYVYFYWKGWGLKRSGFNFQAHASNLRKQKYALLDAPVF